jgi:hypothetical protein
MPRKSSAKKRPKHADPDQPKRFIETAVKLGADKDEGALDRAFKKIAPNRN